MDSIRMSSSIEYTQKKYYQDKVEEDKSCKIDAIDDNIFALKMNIINNNLKLKNRIFHIATMHRLDFVYSSVIHLIFMIINVWLKIDILFLCNFLAFGCYVLSFFYFDFVINEIGKNNDDIYRKITELEKSKMEVFLSAYSDWKYNKYETEVIKKCNVSEDDIRELFNGIEWI